MKYIIFILLLVSSIKCESRLNENIEEIEGILQLNRNNYSFAIQKYKNLIVLFTTYDCNICLRFKPIFIELSKRLKEYDIVLGEINAFDNRALAIKMKSNSYPALYQYNNGERINFPNDESIELLYEYALQHTYGLITYLHNQNDINLFLKRNNIVCLLNFKWEDIIDIAVKVPQIKFGIISDTTIYQDHKAYIKNKQISNFQFFDGQIQELLEFINLNSYPQIFTLTEEEFKKAEQDELSLIGIFINNNENNTNLINVFQLVAQDYQGKLRFVIINQNNELSIRRFQYFAGESLEYNRIYYYSFETKHTESRPFDKISTSSLKQIVEDIQIYKEDKFEGDGFIHELAPINYQIQVNQNNNHILLLIEPNNCEQCFYINEIFFQLTIKYQHRINLFFAKNYSSKKPLKQIIVSKLPSIIAILKLENEIKMIEYQNEYTIDELSKFIEDNIPTTIYIQYNFPETSGFEIDYNNFDQIILQNNLPVLFWLYKQNCEHSKAFNSIAEQLYQQYNGQIILARADFNKYQFSDFNPNQLPAIFLIKQNQIISQYEYITRSLEDLKLFIYNNLNYKPKNEIYINTGKVIQLTNENFQDIVINSNYDVFVKFYAPWCTHCKNMQKDYEILAYNLKGNNQFLITEIDATVNIIKGININGFPTLILFHKDKGSVEQILYKGKRTTKMMKEFLDSIEIKKEEL